MYSTRVQEFIDGNCPPNKTINMRRIVTKIEGAQIVKRTSNPPIFMIPELAFSSGLELRVCWTHKIIDGLQLMYEPLLHGNMSLVGELGQEAQKQILLAARIPAYTNVDVHPRLVQMPIPSWIYCDCEEGGLLKSRWYFADEIEQLWEEFLGLRKKG